MYALWTLRRPRFDVNNDDMRSKLRYHHGNLGNALVARATELIERDGTERFSLREAARLEGVSAKAAYRHFADKADLLAAVAEHGFKLMEQKLVETVEAVAVGGSAAAVAVERLKAAGRGYVAFAIDHPELLRVMFSANGLATLDDKNAFQPAAFALLGRTLDDLARAGVLPADRRAGAELKAWTVVHGFASLVVQAGGANRATPAASSLLESVLDFAMIGLCGRLDHGA